MGYVRLPTPDSITLSAAQLRCLVDLLEAGAQGVAAGDLPYPQHLLITLVSHQLAVWRDERLFATDAARALPALAGAGSPPPLAPDERRCSKCHQVQPLYEFERKGWRRGQRVRRGVCRACRPSRRVLRPLMDNGTERKCLVCGQWKRLTRYYRSGHWYRCRTCAHCRREIGRGVYRRRRRNAGQPYTPRPRRWKLDKYNYA